MSVSNMGQMRVGLTLDDQLTPGLKSASDAVIAFTAGTERMLSALGRIGPAAAPLLAIGIGLKSSVGAAADLQQQIANLNAVMQITPQAMAKIQASALDLSRQTQFNTSQIIQAQAQLGKAGVTPTAAIQQSRDVLNLASATFTDPTTAAKAFITVQNQFQLSTADATGTVNDLARAVDSSTGTLMDLMAAYKQLGPVAHSASLSVHETDVAIASLMNSGLQGDTGTALKTFLQRIQHETPQARAEVERLGLSFYDQAGKLKPLADIFDEIRAKTVGLTDEQKNFSLTQIFGARGVRVADIASEQGSQGLLDTENHMRSLGSASDIAAAKLDTLQGQTHILASSLNVLAVETGNSVLPMLRSMADFATLATNALSKIPAPLQNALVGFGAIYGINRLNTGLTERRNEPIQAAQAALDQQRMQSAGALAAQRDLHDAASRNYASALAQAEFTADSQIVAAHKEMTAALDQIDLAHTEHAIAAFRAQSAAIQAIQDQLDASMMASAAKQSITFDKQFAQLGLKQAGQQDLVAIQNSYALKSAGSSPEGMQRYRAQQLAAEQELAQGQLMEEQKLEQAYSAKYAEIQMAEAQQRIAAVNAAGNLELQNLREQAAMNRAAQAELYAQRLAAADAGLANGAAGASNAYADAEMAIAGRGKGPIGASVAAVNTTGMASAARGKIGAALASVSATVGEFIFPVTIALVARQMLIDPLLDSIAKKQADAKTGSTFANAILGYQSDYGTYRANAEAFLNQNQKALEEAQAAHANRNPIVKAFGATIGRFDVGTHFVNQQYDDEIKDFQQNVSDAKKSLDDLQAMRAQFPNVVKGAINDYSSTLIDAIQSGDVDAKTAIAQYSGTVDMYLALAKKWTPGGLRGDIGDIVSKSQRDFAKSATDTYTETLRQQVLAAQQHDENLKTIQTLHQQASFVGRTLPSDGDLMAGLEGTDKSSADVIKKVQEEAAKLTTQMDDALKKDAQHVQDLDKAWQSLGQSLSKIDLSKGVGNLAGASDDLKQMQIDLKKLDINSLRLDGLIDISNAFKEIADAEDQASSAFHAYQMEMAQTSDFLSTIDTFKKGFYEVLNAAQQAVRLGTANDAQKQLVAGRTGIESGLDKQSAALYANAASSYLGEAQNFPQLDKFDAAYRAKITELGGAPSVFMHITSNIKDLEEQIKAVANGSYFARLNISIGGAFPGGNNGATTIDGNDPYGPSTVPPTGGTTNAIDSALKAAGMPDWMIAQVKKGLFGGGSGSALASGGSTATPHGSAAGIASYAQYIKDAAQSAGIDPNLLGEIIMHESSGTPGIVNPSSGASGLTQVLPSAHPEYDVDKLRGTSDADIKYQIESGAKILAQHIAIEGGDVRKGVQDYGGGSAYPGSYYDDLQRYGPGVSNALGGGGAGGYGPAQVAGSEHLTTQASIDSLNDVIPGAGGTGSSSVLATAKQHLGQQFDKAGRAVYGWCEEIVDDILQETTGTDNRFGSADARIRAAMAGAPGAGKVVSQEDARPGDLVGWTGDSQYAGSPSGHIGVYSGSNMYIGTTQNGVQERKLGAGAVFIRPDGVVSAGPTPGSILYTSSQMDTRPTLGVNASLSPNTDLTKQPGQADPTKALYGLDPSFLNMFKGLSPKNASLLSSRYDESFNSFKAMNEGTMPNKTDEDKRAITVRTIQQATAASQAWADAMKDVQNGTAVTQQHLQAIAATGGPIGQGLVMEAKLTAEIERANRNIKQDKADITDLDRAHKSDMDTRSQEDRDERAAQQSLQRGRTTDDWKTQDAQEATQRGWQEQQRQQEKASRDEDDRWTKESRQWQDKQRALDFFGTTEQLQIQTNTRALEKQNTLRIAGNRAQELLLSGNVANAATPAGKRGQSELLAIAKDYDAKQDEDYKKKLSDLKDLGDEQDFNNAKAKYDLETQTIAETRVHEDKLRGIDDERYKLQLTMQLQQDDWSDSQKQLGRLRQLQDWMHEDDINQRNDARAIRDKDYETAKQQKQDDITQNQDLITGWNDDLAAVKGIEQEVSKLFPLIGDAVSALFDPILGTVMNGTNPTAPQAGRRLGNAGGTDYAIPGATRVGESGMELILSGGERVITNANTRALLSALSGSYNAAPAAQAQAPTTVHYAPTFIQQPGQSPRDLFALWERWMASQSGGNDAARRAAASGVAISLS